MRELFQKLYETVNFGTPVVLVTIVAGSGSTPRGSGARMLVTKEGRIAGTIGGGQVEFEAEKLAKQCILSEGSTRASYRLDHNEVADIGMICGGNVDVYFRYIPGHDKYMLSLSEKAVELFDKDEQSWIVTEIGPDNDGTISIFSKESGLFGSKIPEEVPGLAGNRPFRVSAGGKDYYVEKLVVPGRVYIFGGGHVSQKLVPALAGCGFKCVVIEDRPAFADPKLFEKLAYDIRVMDMNEVDKLVNEIGPDDYVCIMTRGHKDDYLIQKSMLKTKACYIGVIGSSHKKAGVNAKLMEDGFTLSDISRITTPIGLDILAETPEEIAVAVAAQLIEVRASKNGSRKVKKLFLEGDSGLGKTTLILNTLGEELVKIAGGFSTVRLTDENGKRLGYSVKPASEMHSAGEPAGKDNTKNMFISFRDTERIIPTTDTKAFTAFVTTILKEAPSAPYILMDEFGGIELEDDSFTQALINVILSDKPMVGVIKSRKSAEKMAERMGLKDNYLKNYGKVRAALEKESKEIIDIRAKGTEYVERKLKAFKDGLL